MSTVHKTLNILAVEDDPADLYLLERMLRSGLLPIKSLYSADRVEEARKILQACEIDIVLLDLSLPDSSGIDTFLGIQQAACKIPVIILNGLSDSGVAMEAIKSGAQDFLVKGELTENLLAKSIRYSLERKRNLEVLQESNDRFNAVIKATNEIIWDWNLQTNEVYLAGENFKKFFGIECVVAARPVGEISECIHPEDRERVMNNLHQFIKDHNKVIWESEYRLKKADGTYAYIHDRAYKIYDPAARPLRLIGSLQDITQRKNAEERFRQMFYNNPYPIIFYDPETLAILEVNDAALKTYGYTHYEFLNLTLKDVIYEKDVSRLLLIFSRLSVDQVVEKKLRHHKKKNGEIMIVEVTNYPIDYFGKTVRQLLISDVTEKIRLENELIQQQKLKQQHIAEAVLIAQENEKTALGEELHDNINQVLTAAKLSLEYAQQNSANSQEMVNKSIRFLSLAIQEIRKLCKAMIIGSAKELNLRQAIEEVAENTLMKPSIQTDIQMELDERSLNPNLKISILRMVQEQLNNIVKHAEATSVSIQLKRHSNEILLTITDNGKGFDPAKKSKGVGITNITNRARLYNGRVEIDSAPGEGCRLKAVLLPGR